MHLLLLVRDCLFWCVMNSKLRPSEGDAERGADDLPEIDDRVHLVLERVHRNGEADARLCCFCQNIRIDRGVVMFHAISNHLFSCQLFLITKIKNYPPTPLPVLSSLGRLLNSEARAGPRGRVDRRVHADELAGGVQQRAAGVPGVDRGVRLDHVRDRSAARRLHLVYYQMEHVQWSTPENRSSQNLQKKFCGISADFSIRCSDLGINQYSHNPWFLRKNAKITTFQIISRNILRFCRNDTQNH